MGSLEDDDVAGLVNEEVQRLVRAELDACAPVKSGRPVARVQLISLDVNEPRTALDERRLLELCPLLIAAGGVDAHSAEGVQVDVAPPVTVENLPHEALAEEAAIRLARLEQQREPLYLLDAA